MASTSYTLSEFFTARSIPWPAFAFALAVPLTRLTLEATIFQVEIAFDHVLGIYVLQAVAARRDECVLSTAAYPFRQLCERCVMAHHPLSRQLSKQGISAGCHLSGYRCTSCAAKHKEDRQTSHRR